MDMPPETCVEVADLAASFSSAGVTAHIQAGPNSRAQQLKFPGRHQDETAPAALRDLHSVSVIIPVYNSEKILPLLLKRLEPVLAALCREYEVILVNDSSRDKSWEVIQRTSQDCGWVRGIDLMRNYGQHNAILCGIRAAKFDTIVTMDDDLQNPPEEIPKLLSKLAEGFDVVYGATPSGRQGLWREMASRLTRAVLRGAMQIEVANQVSSFRAVRAPVCQAFGNYQSPFVCIDVLLSWSTSRFAAVGVAQDIRRLGVSSYTLPKLLAHGFTMMTGFSTWPLRLSSMIGFGFTAFGVLVLAYVLGQYVVCGRTVPGFAFLASAIAVFSGAQLFALGIIGEYLGRLYYRMMERPPYAVREQTRRIP